MHNLLGSLIVLEVVKVTLAPTRQVGQSTLPILIDALWAIVPISLGMQHINARLGEGNIDLVLFFVSDEGNTSMRARMLCEHALSYVPFLRGWRLVCVEPITLTPPDD